MQEELEPGVRHPLGCGCPACVAAVNAPATPVCEAVDAATARSPTSGRSERRRTAPRDRSADVRLVVMSLPPLFDFSGDYTGDLLSAVVPGRDPVFRVLIETERRRPQARSTTHSSRSYLVAEPTDDDDSGLVNRNKLTIAALEPTFRLERHACPRNWISMAIIRRLAIRSSRMTRPRWREFNDMSREPCRYFRPRRPSFRPTCSTGPPTPDSDARWWVIHTRPRAEKSLARKLLDAGSGVLPADPGPVVALQRPAVRVAPAAFPRLRLPARPAGRPGKRSLDQDGGELSVGPGPGRTDRRPPTGPPGPVGRTAVEHQAALPPGTPVEVIDGVLQGLTGTVVRSGRQAGVYIQVRLIGQGVLVELDPRLLRPAEQLIAV